MSGTSLYRSARSFFFSGCPGISGIWKGVNFGVCIHFGKLKSITGIFFFNRSLAATMSALSPVCTVAASLRKSVNTFRSLPNTPLLIHSSTESVSGFSGSKREATAEIATSAPTNFANVAHEPAPPIMTASAVAPNTRPAPFPILSDGRPLRPVPRFPQQAASGSRSAKVRASLILRLCG